jgi:hypothetical protein
MLAVTNTIREGDADVNRMRLDLRTGPGVLARLELGTGHGLGRRRA